MKTIKLILTVFLITTVCFSSYSQNQSIEKATIKKERNVKPIKMVKKVELSNSKNLENARIFAEKFTAILKEEIKEGQPFFKEGKKLIEKLEKDKNFGIQLISLIGQDKAEEASILVGKLVKQNVNVIIEHEDKYESRFQLCIKNKCWPKDKIDDCPRW